MPPVLSMSREGGGADPRPPTGDRHILPLRAACVGREV